MYVSKYRDNPLHQPSRTQPMSRVHDNINAQL